MTMSVGPKEAQLHELRARGSSLTKLENVVPPAGDQPAPAEDATASAVAETKQETPVKNAKTTKAKKPAKAKKAAFSPKAKTAKKVASKTATVGILLRRAGGCTGKDVLKATGWPTVSMPAMAKALGVKLKKEKVDGVTRYSAA